MVTIKIQKKNAKEKYREILSEVQSFRKPHHLHVNDSELIFYFKEDITVDEIDKIKKLADKPWWRLW